MVNSLEERHRKKNLHLPNSITIYEEQIIVFYRRAIPAICVTQNATQLESQKGASKHSH